MNLRSIPLMATMIPFIYIVPKSYSYIVIPVILMLILLVNKKTLIKYLYIKLIIISPIIFSLLFVTMEFSSAEDIRYIPILFLIISFPYFNMNVKYVAELSLFSIVFVLTSQLGMAVGLDYFINFRNEFYPIELDLWTSDGSINGGFSFRSIRYGGIYYNPNVMGQMLTLLLVTYLLSAQGSKLIFLVMGAVLAGLILTGSRTSLLVAVIILGWYLKDNIDSKMNKHALILIGVVTFIILGGTFLESFKQGIFQGDGSANIKLSILLNYLRENQASFYGGIKILLGSGSNENVVFDSDIGDIIGHFGLMGFSSVCLFVCLIYMKIPKIHKYSIAIILFMLGNTFLYNLQASIAFFVILALAFSKVSYRKKDFLL